MKGLENNTYLIGYIISNVVAVIMLVAAWKRPWAGRVFFLILFAWACWINWKTASQSPQMYLDYADLAISDWYAQFIRGWFSSHIQLMVGFIATCQGLIATALLLRGWISKIGIIGGVAFLLAILPLGVGAAFPATLIMAAGLVLLFGDSSNYIWESMQARKKPWLAEIEVKQPVSR